jgi:hypothetical protein
MGSAEIGDCGMDAIVRSTQPHGTQQDQAAAALNGFLIEDMGKVFFGKGNRGAGGG